MQGTQKSRTPDLVVMPPSIEQKTSFVFKEEK